MSYQKYIKRGGKLYGPYVYHSKKINGKVISEYLGKAEEKSKRKTFPFFFTTIILILIVSVVLIPFYVENKIDFSKPFASFKSPITGFNILGGGATLVIGSSNGACLYGEVTDYETIYVNASGVLNVCPFNETDGTGWVNISLGANGNFTIDAGGIVNASGKGGYGGYPSIVAGAGKGAKQGWNSTFNGGINSTSANGGGGGGGQRNGGAAADGGGGGGFGGTGGVGGDANNGVNDVGGSGGETYGADSSTYLLAGSGGGGGAGDAINTSALLGGIGGGGFKVDAGNGVIRIAGTIYANGNPGLSQSGSVTTDVGAGGGGSGGHIILISSNVIISGILNVSGGDGGNATALSTDAEDLCGGGGGGGGRIVILYNTLSNDSMIAGASGGKKGTTGTSCSPVSTDGSQGTIFFNLTNSHPSTPTNIQCDGNDNCNITVDTSVVLNASGSIDQENDIITYSIGAFLIDPSTIQDATDVSIRIPSETTVFYNVTTNSFSVTRTSVSTTHTINGNNTLLLVFCVGEAYTASNATFQDVQMTPLIDATQNVSSDAGFVSAWYKVGASGFGTATCTLASNDNGGIIAISFTEVNQENPFGNYTGKTQTSGSQITFDLTTLYNNSLIVSALSGMGGDTDPFTPQSGQEEKWDFASGTGTGADTGYAGGYTNAPTAGNYALNWAMSVSDDSAIVGIEARSVITTDINTTETAYVEVAKSHVSVDNITIIVEVDSYDPSVSVSESTTYPDLWLKMYNGTDWVDIGAFDLPSIYTGTGLQTNKENFSFLITDSGILSGWLNRTNQNLKIKGIYMDSNTTYHDEINYTGVWIIIDGFGWQVIGSHINGTTFEWNTTDLKEQDCINIRVRAVDLDGSETYSDYFTKGSCLNISHTVTSDSEYPWFSNYWNNSGETEPGTAQINVTVTSTNGTVILTFDNTNYTASNNSGSATRFNVTITGLSEGIYYYNWSSYGNGTSNLYNVSDTFSYTVGATDTTKPNLTIIFPSNNTNTSNNQININYTASDDVAVGSCWYSNDSFTKNETLASCGTNITGVTWAEGAHNIRVYANDSAGNVNVTSVRFTIDTIKPRINIVYPSNNTNTSNNQININYTVSDAGSGIDSCWYSNDSYKINVSLSNCANITTVTWAEGKHNITVYVNDSAGNENKSSVYFTIDSIAPVVYLIGPLNNSLWNSTNMVNFTYNVSDTNEILNCSLIINGEINQNNLTIKKDTDQTFNQTLENGNYNWSINCTDNFNNVGSSGNYNLTVNTTVAFSISLSQRLTQAINWSLASLPISSQHAEGNNETGETLYYVNVSVEGGTIDLYMKASGDLMTPGLDLLALGNETYSYNSTNASVPFSTKFALTKNYEDSKIGSSLTNGNVIYLKFFLSAPSRQPAGSYNNTVMFKAVPSGEPP